MTRPKKNGQATDLKKLTRLITPAVFVVGMIMLGFTGWFIRVTLEGVSTANLGRHSNDAKVEAINVQLLERLREEARDKGSADRKLPDKLKDPFTATEQSADRQEQTPGAPAPPPKK